MSEVQIIFSTGGEFYAVPEIRRECSLWLSVEKHRLPVLVEWHRPDSICACIMPNRHYYRIGMFRPLHMGRSESASIDDERVRDYRDAAWWTPGLEEAWIELQGMKEALARAAKLHVREQTGTSSVIPARVSGVREESRRRQSEDAGPFARQPCTRMTREGSDGQGKD